jgi:hypothetical protein
MVSEAASRPHAASNVLASSDLTDLISAPCCAFISILAINTSSADAGQHALYSPADSMLLQ